MKKIRLLTFLIFMLFFGSAYSSYAFSTDITVKIDENILTFENKPFIKNDRVLVPMRTIFENLGYDITWNDKNKSVYAVKGSTDILLTIGSDKAYFNDVIFTLDAPPEITDSRTYVPLRFVAEATKAQVTWDETNYIVSINTDKKDNLQKEYTPSDSVVMITTNKMQGSGVILSSDGIIVTNFHVVQNASFLSVIFNNMESYSGEVKILGYDIKRDLVILKINKADLYPCTISTSSTLKEDENVTSIGSPLGVLNTVTTGKIVSFSNDIICSSAKIQLGSSGGGLFNSNNELIGITSSFSQETSSYLSIPIKYLLNISTKNSYPLREVSSLEISPSKPENIVVFYENDYTCITWSPIYGIDYYRLYKSETADGKYSPVMNPDSSENKWNWGYPESIGIKTSVKSEMYFKISSVVNDVESSLSEPIYVLTK